MGLGSITRARVTLAGALVLCSVGCQVIGGIDGMYIDDSAPQGGAAPTGGAGGVGDPCDVVGSVVYVQADAPSDGTGASWEDATTLASAFERFETCGGVNELWVAEGLYTVAAPDAPFVLPTGAHLIGGFAGTESSVETRDWRAHPTVLSGDVDGDDETAESGLVPGAAALRGDNAAYVVDATTATVGTTLDGFFITGAQSDAEGAAVHVGAGSVALSRLHIQGNASAIGGAGVYSVGGHPVLEDVTFVANRSGSGGAVFADGGSLGITDAVFDGNEALVGGGAIYSTASLTAEGIELTSNSAATDGGAIFVRDGLASLSRISARGNTCTSRGGAVFAQAGIVRVDNAIFSGNVGDGAGGAVFVDTASVHVAHATVAGNRSLSGGGLHVAAPGDLDVVNSIVFSNADALDASSVTHSIVNHGDTTFTSSNVENTGALWNDAAGTDGGNNIDASPSFLLPVASTDAPTEAGDLHLLASSMSVDAGDASLSDATTDLADQPRLAYDAPDQGAYEVQGHCAHLQVFVSADAAAAEMGDGSSWDSAFPRLQRAILHQQKCPEATEAWVKTGRYVAGPSVWDSIHCGPDCNISFYGSFSGTETSRDERSLDPAAPSTIISGDIDGDDGVTAAGITDSPDDIVGDNSNHLLTVQSQFFVTFDGFTFSGGDAFSDGGAVELRMGTTLRNVRFVGNRAANRGGALHVEFASPVIETALFERNHASDGGAVYIDFGGLTTFRDVTFDNNVASGSAGALMTGISSSPRTDLTRVTFRDNVAGSRGGAAMFGAPSTLLNVRVIGNTAGGGSGGLHFRRHAAATMTNAVITGNVSGGDGGGIGLNRDSGAPSLTLINSTVHGNYAADASGGLFVNEAILTLQNSIVWGNRAGADTAPLAEQQVDSESSTVSVAFSMVEGAPPTAWPSSLGSDDGNNRAGPPAFTLPLPLPDGTMASTGGDVRLLATSNGLDAGDDTALDPVVTTDLDDNPRFVGVVDLGAYERP